MGAVHVDLNARIVSDKTDVYVARPGREYRLYNTFVADKIIAPDLPYLQFERGVPLGSYSDLDARILRSLALRTWWRNRGHQVEAPPPPNDLAEYPQVAGRKITTFRTVLSAYFEKLKIGDLVVVPPSQYGQNAYIGEMFEGPEEVFDVRIPRLYGNNPLTARRVRWIAQIEKRRLPSEVLDALNKPVVIYLLARSLRGPIYDAAFGAYYDLSRAEQDFSATFDLSAPNFSTAIDFWFQAFFNSIASNVKAIEEHKSLKWPRDAAFDDLGEYAPILKSNVNSPGTITLRAARVTPIIAAVMFALATSVGSEAASLAEKDQIVIGNSKAPPGDPCTATIAKSVLDQLTLLGLDKWPAACELARQAAEGSGATSNVKVQR